MTLDDWLDSACADADRRELPELKPLLANLAQATRFLRAADWNDLAGAVRQPADAGLPVNGARGPQGARG
ncbi:MAG: hypothetical protein NTV05_16565 [Acidobacteria bacterium]|nr:hypothetical protein [Acidobacteriota bacterium]